jgi:putative transferase (TIGR04331 family)
MKINKILKIGKFDKFSKKTDLYIGEWCDDNYLNTPGKYFVNDNSYTKKNILKNHLQYLKYYDELEEFVIKKLNLHHKTNHPQRYWKILLGNWLNWYIKIIINRFNLLDHLLQKQKFKQIQFNINKNTQLNSQGTSDINLFCEDPNWNSKVFLKIFKSLKSKKKFKIFYENKKNETNKFKNQIKKSFSTKFLNLISKFFTKKEDIFFIETYFSKIILFKICLRLFQFPVFWRREPFLFKKTNSKIRKRIKISFNLKNDSLKNFIFSNIFDFIPNCILEGYKDNLKKSKTLPYPKNTKLIYTASNFNSDELFKIWTAEKTLNSTKYVIAQHGAGYENFRFHIEKPTEILTPDHYLTWGWGLNDQTFTDKNIFIKFFVTRIFKKSKYSNSSIKKQIVLFLPDRFPSRYTWNTYKEYLEILKLIKNFINFINQSVFKDTILKPLRRGRNDNFQELNKDIKYWYSFNNKIKIIDGNENIHQVYKKTKLCVFFYNSTGVLELISLNKPVILVLSKNQWFNIPKKILKSYEELFKVGVFYKDFESAAHAVNKISKNSDKWWFNKKRQNVLSKFRKNFAQYSHSLDGDFVKQIKMLKNY